MKFAQSKSARSTLAIMVAKAERADFDFSAILDTNNNHFFIEVLCMYFVFVLRGLLNISRKNLYNSSISL